MEVLRKLARLDRRIIYFLIAVAVVVPVFYPMGLPIKINKTVQAAYDYTEKLKPGSQVLFSIDYGPATAVELAPAALAAADQLLKKDCKIAFMTLWPEGTALTDELIGEIQKLHPQAKYGERLTNLGFKAGNDGALVKLGLDFRGLFPVDSRGTQLADLPMMQRITRLQDFDLVINYSAGFPGAVEHIRITNGQYKLPLIVATTAVQTPQYYPFFDSEKTDSGQIVGLIGGLRGAAEYEKLAGFKGKATPGMDAQSIAHFVIAGLILLANLIFFLEKLIPSTEPSLKRSSEREQP